MGVKEYKLDGRKYYLTDVRIGRRRLRKYGFKSRKDAQNHIDGLKEKTGGNLTNSTTIPFAAASEKYLITVSVNKSKTLYGLERVWLSKLNIYLKSERKRKYMHEVELLDLQSYQTALKNHMSAGTVNRRFDCFKSFFNTCVDWQLLVHSPAQKLKRLPHRSKERKTWPRAAIMEIHAELPNYFADIFLFIAMTGCRPGEARNLKWADVDFRRGHVNLTSIKGGQGARVRDFPLTGTLERFMTNYYSSQKNKFRARPRDLVFPNANGQPFDPSSLQKCVKRLTEKKGYEDLCIYGLRHTFTTSLLEQDVSLEKVRLLVGHEKITTTQNYAHVNRTSLRDAALKYDFEEGVG